MPKKKSTTCSICYEPLNRTVSPCECRICDSCWSQVIITKIKDSNSLQEKITCPIRKCPQILLIKTLYHKLPRSFKHDIDQAVFDTYLTSAPDIRQCPSPNCNYAGIIDLSSSCSENLHCEACGGSWRDKAHYNQTERIQESITHLTHNKNEIFSMLWKRLRAKRCPSCQIIVERNGGCEHLTCTQCQYNFCWICLEKHPKHKTFVHTLENNIKPLLYRFLQFLVFCLVMFFIYCLPTVHHFIHLTAIPFASWIWDRVGGVSMSFLSWVAACCLLSFGMDSAATLHIKIVHKSDYPPVKKRVFVIQILVSMLLVWYFQLLYQVMILGSIFGIVVILMLLKELLLSKRQP